MESRLRVAFRRTDLAGADSDARELSVDLRRQPNIPADLRERFVQRCSRLDEGSTRGLDTADPPEGLGLLLSGVRDPESLSCSGLRAVRVPGREAILGDEEEASAQGVEVVGRRQPNSMVQQLRGDVGAPRSRANLAARSTSSTTS